MSISKFITRKAFPEGDFQNIRANAPNQMSYNIDATRDLVRNQPLNPYAPALAATMSLPYDVSQGIGRAFEGFEPDTGILDYDVVPNAPTFADIGKSIAAENPIDSLLGRTYGATLGLGDKLTDYAQGLKGLFDSSAMANEPMSIEDFQVQNIEDRPIASVPSNFLNYKTPLNDRTPFTPVREGITTLRDKLGSLKDKGIDVGRMALSGIGRYALGPVGGIVGGLIGGLANQFENRPLGANVIDEFGNTFDFNDLNKQNALGGYYTDPARSARRRTRRIANLLERQKLGKKFSQKNLEKLLEQEKAQEAAQRSAMDAMFARGQGGSGQDFTGGRYDGAGSKGAYDANPTGFSGSS